VGVRQRAVLLATPRDPDSSLTRETLHLVESLLYGGPCHAVDDPTFKMRVYRHGMRRDADAKALLQALVGPEMVLPAAVPSATSGRAAALARR
jgi:hypothetical protein